MATVKLRHDDLVGGNGMSVIANVRYNRVKEYTTGYILRRSFTVLRATLCSTKLITFTSLTVY
jgi:hypothetical protein